jgi:pilus assembly protein CpaD
MLVVGRYVVTTPDCPDWTKPTTGDRGNSPSGNFGCATATNLGLMVADPGGLVVGRSLGPNDPYLSTGAVRRYRDDKVKPLPRDNDVPRDDK